MGWPWFQFPLSIFFLFLFSHYVVYQQFPVASICCSLFFSILLSRLLGVFYAIPHRRPFPLPLSGHLLFFCQFYMSDSFHMTIPCQPNPYQFLLTTFLHSSVHSHFINSSLIRSINSHDSSCWVVLQTSTFSRCWGNSRALSLRDMRLSYCFCLFAIRSNVYILVDSLIIVYSL